MPEQGERRRAGCHDDDGRYDGSHETGRRAGLGWRDVGADGQTGGLDDGMMAGRVGVKVPFVRRYHRGQGIVRDRAGVAAMIGHEWASREGQTQMTGGYSR